MSHAAPCSPLTTGAAGATPFALDARARASTAPLARPFPLRARDGRVLGATLHEPGGPARGTVVIHGATATPHRFYGRFALYLAGQGYRVLSYDYRGVGASRPPALAGFHATLTEWATLDAAAAHAAARALAPTDPLFLVAHSFGGQALGVEDALHDVDGALLVASQLGWSGHWPTTLERARLAFTWRVAIPTTVAAFGYVPARLGLGEDLPGGVALEWARWGQSPGYLREHVPGAEARFARFDRPTLQLSFSDDWMAPRPAAEALSAALSSAPLEHRVIEARAGSTIGHFGFFRSGGRGGAGTGAADGQPLWREATAFFAAVEEQRWPRSRRLPRAAHPALITQAELDADLAYGRG